MPEGDEVYLTCKRLHAALAGHELVRAELRHPLLSTVDLTGRVVTEVRPVGKHLLLRLDDGRTLHNHLRMDGSWHLYAPGARWKKPGHQARAVLGHAERTAVGFNLHDLQLLPTAQESRLVGHLGPDLLAPEWTDEHAAEAVRRLTARPEREIGAALLDQAVLAGVGNLYKAEVCFLLGRSPHTPVHEIDAERAVQLSRDLLRRNAERPQQITTGDPRRGREQWVYGRRRCLRCGGPVTRSAQGRAPEERVSYHCPRCQP